MCLHPSFNELISSPESFGQLTALLTALNELCSQQPKPSRALRWQMALEAAIVVLKDFYKVPGMISKEPWEFLQTGSGRDVELPEKPSTWDSSYTGTSYPNVGGEGIFTILNETMQKFSKMEADAKGTDETDSITGKRFTGFGS